MIAKIMNRVDFGGIVNYAHNDKDEKKRANLLAHQGVCITDNKTITDSFYVQAAMRPGRKSPVKHISLSFSPRDLSRLPENEKGDALMAEIAKEWMRRMGIINTQYIIARHHDTRHPHCHVVYNLVDNNGGVISDSCERYRSSRICRALTEEYGLYMARKNSKEQNRNRLRPHQLKKADLRTAVLDARSVSHNWSEFTERLGRCNIDARVTYQKDTHQAVGISFGKDDMYISGSKLDCDLSYPSLCSFFGNAIEEVLFMPHAQTVSPVGGGTSNNQGWRDDDDEKWKHQKPTIYQPSKRRR